MKVLAFNSSPYREHGGTTLILNLFLEGMAEAGAEVEKFFVDDLDIRPCRGFFTCLVDTPGECVYEDDMSVLYPKIIASDILVLATPAYMDGMTGSMKTLVDRFIPLIERFFKVRDNPCPSPLPEQLKSGGKLALVAASAHTAFANFDPLVMHVKAIADNLNREFAGALLRPYGEALPYIQDKGLPVEEIYRAIREAGCQLVRDGAIDAATLDAVKRDIAPCETVVNLVNEYVRQQAVAREKVEPS